MSTTTVNNTQPHSSAYHHEDGGSSERTIFGFWLYLMTDLILFGGLFITYVVLQGNVVDGPSATDIFELPFVMGETFLLLFSSFTFGLAMLALKQKRRNRVMQWLGVTFLLGFGFIVMELYEFNVLINEGYAPSRSAFLSAFFTLVGTHGIHVTVGLLWIATMMVHLWKWGITAKNTVRLMCLSLFWHFLDIVWVCLFSVVYLIGKTPI